MEVQSTDDLHDLMTLEPNNMLYRDGVQQPGPAAMQAVPTVDSISQEQFASVFSHSTSIFSPNHPQHPRPSDITGFSSPLQQARLPIRAFEPPMEQPSSSRRPQMYTTSRPSTSRKAHIHRAEKDSDDVENPRQRRRRSLHAGSTATSATLNRLFGGKYAASPSVSRQASYSPQDAKSAYTRALTTETATIPNHLYSRGLLEGRHSDIVVKVFGHSYPLHRLILDRAPFFASALSEPWVEASQKEIELHPDEIDANITQTTFELALKRLYGCHDITEEDGEAGGLFATGCWLEMQDLIDASVDSILRRLETKTLAPMLQLVTSNYYGKSGEKILTSAKAMLSRDGWLMPLRCWDGIPSDLVRELIAGDGFFIHGEFERFLLARRLLNRRLKAAARKMGLWKSVAVPKWLQAQANRPSSTTSHDQIEPPLSPFSTASDPLQDWLGLYRLPTVEPLLNLLDDGVHYIHMDFEQLQTIRSARDILGVPLLPEKIVADALWSSLELRQKVLNAKEKDLTLGLSQTSYLVSESNQTESSTVPGSTSKKAAGKKRHTEGHGIERVMQRDSALGDAARFWIPSADCNIVVGGNTNSMVTSTSNANRQASRLSTALQAHESAHWSQDTPMEQAPVGTLNDTRATSYSAFPPFRFAAEFPSPRVLKERKRVYSRTVFYAGSFWNVYIQKVKSGSKTPQLGVYLHRAKERDPEDRLGGAAVDERIDALEREMLMRREHGPFRSSIRTSRRGEQAGHGADVDDASSGPDADTTRGLHDRSHRPGLSNLVSYRRRLDMGARNAALASGTLNAADAIKMAAEASATTPQLSSASVSPLDTDTTSDEEIDNTYLPTVTPPWSATSNATLPPYVDARPTIKTYFKIYSPSRGGRMLSVYESAPDNFNFSQSWGWKSSSLMLEDERDELNGTDVGVSRTVEHSGTGLRGEDLSDDELVDAAGADLAGLGLSRNVGEQDVGVGGAPRARRNLRFMVVLGVV